MAHSLTRLWIAAGQPPPRDAAGEVIQPGPGGAACAFTGDPAEYAWSQALSENFGTLRRIVPPGAASEPELSLSTAAAWAARELALRCATWILEPAEDGDVLEWCPSMRPAPERAEEHRAVWGDRTADGFLAWLLRPRPAGTVAAYPKTGIEHGGEMCLGRCGWPGVGWRRLSAASVVEYRRAERPLLKLQAKHVALFARPSRHAGTLLLQVDSDLVVEVETQIWTEARPTVETAAAELVELGVRASAVRRGLDQHTLDLRAPPAAHARLAELLRDLGRLHRHPFWSIFCGGIHV